MAQVHTSLLTGIRKRFVCLSTAVFLCSDCIVLKRIDVLDKHRPHSPCSSLSLYNVLQLAHSVEEKGNGCKTLYLFSILFACRLLRPIL